MAKQLSEQDKKRLVEDIKQRIYKQRRDEQIRMLIEAIEAKEAKGVKKLCVNY